MSRIIRGSQTVQRSDDVVVLAIGARVNKWWLLPLSMPILSRMGAMLKELEGDPSSGFLGVQPLGVAAMLQYWRSVEDLQRYANDKAREHRPAAKRFYQKLFANQAVGVWHETYALPAGHYEGLYVNMPAFGLGKLGGLVPALGALAQADQRMSAAGLAVGRGGPCLNPGGGEACTDSRS